MKRTFGGPASGPGSNYAWNGNRKAGEGRMEIADATPSSKVTVNIAFKRPIEDQSVLTFSMTPEGDATKVRWVMDGKNSFMSKVMAVFVSMDAMVGNDFATGLANLKAVAEQ